MPIISTCTTLLLTLPVVSRFCRTSLRASTSVLATVLTSPSSVRVTAVNFAVIPRRVAYVLFWVHLFVTFDCVCFQRSCNVTNFERVNVLQEQVVATLFDSRNSPDLNCTDQHDQGWALLHGMVIAVIDEVKNSDALTDRRCQWFLGHSLRRCCCEFSWPFKRRLLTGRSRYGRLAPFPFPRTRILSTSGVAVLCLFFFLVGCVGEACTCYSWNCHKWPCHERGLSRIFVVSEIVKT